MLTFARVADAIVSRMSGSFYLLMMADGVQAIVEASESNNVAARTLQLNR